MQKWWENLFIDRLYLENDTKSYTGYSQKKYLNMWRFQGKTTFKMATYDAKKGDNLWKNVRFRNSQDIMHMIVLKNVKT